jgi:aryl-alcohol dehydrogenase-like predicted oxidoreductase
MQYLTLGHTGLSISRIGFGCMSLKPNQPDAQQIIDAAIDNGINYFDTADLYDKGANEELLGKALRSKRQKVIIASKAGNQWRADGSGWDWNPTKAYILSCIDKSLQRLQTDYIDVYQLHGGTIEDPIDETIEAFELLKQQGKIRHYGISSIRPNVIREYVKRSNIQSVMMQYSLLDRRPEEAVLLLLEQKGISVLARGSVASGLLAGKPTKSYLNYTDDEVAEAAKVINDITSDQRNAVATAIQFAIHHPAITSAIVGIRTMQHLQDAISAVQAPALTAAEYAQLTKAITPNTYQDHR